MKNLLSLIALISFQFSIYSQNITPLQECGTILTPEQEVALDKQNSAREAFMNDKSRQKTTLFIPVQHHIVRRTNGTGGLSPSDIAKIMQELNHYYSAANIVYFMCAPINYIDDDTYFDFSSSQESTLGFANDVQNVVNIYYFNSATSGSTPVCGYTRFPPSVDRVIMVNSCALNGSTIVHELGHYFTLYHTHGTSNFGTTDELVDGTNCSTHGDRVCDTPADPNLSGVVNTDCDYTGTAVDANNQTFSPQTNNIMSYSRKACRKLITSGQMSRVEFGAINGRNYLICPSPMAPVANFTVNTTESCDGIVEFYDMSSSISTNYHWTFGDGATSNLRNPIHVYSSNGQYTVKLRVSNSNGSDSITQSNIVNVNLPASPTIDPVDSICKGDFAVINTSGSGNVMWYSSPTSTTPIGQGNSFTTPFLTKSKTYFASAVYPNAVLNLGPSTNGIGTSVNFTDENYLIFDALKPFTLKSVKVYANSSGPRTFELRNSLGLILQDITVNVSSGQQTVNLDFDVPAGQDLQLGLSVISDIDLQGNISGASYPYNLSGIAKITGSNTGPIAYYFFYDWKVQTTECQSARTSVTVGVKNCVSAISEHRLLSEISVRPNPSAGTFYIENSVLDNVNCEILNVVGKVVYRTTLQNGKNVLELNDLSNGIYFIKYSLKDVSSVERIVIKK